MTEIPIQLAKDRAWPLVERLNAALERGEIDEDEWHRQLAAVIVPAYLAAQNPRAQPVAVVTTPTGSISVV